MLLIEEIKKIKKLMSLNEDDEVLNSILDRIKSNGINSLNNKQKRYLYGLNIPVDNSKKIEKFNYEITVNYDHYQGDTYLDKKEKMLDDYEKTVNGIPSQMGKNVQRVMNNNIRGEEKLIKYRLKKNGIESEVTYSLFLGLGIFYHIKILAYSDSLVDETVNILKNMGWNITDIKNINEINDINQENIERIINKLNMLDNTIIPLDSTDEFDILLIPNNKYNLEMQQELVKINKVVESVLIQNNTKVRNSLLKPIDDKIRLMLIGISKDEMDKIRILLQNKGYKIINNQK